MTSAEQTAIIEAAWQRKLQNTVTIPKDIGTKFALWVQSLVATQAESKDNVEEGEANEAAGSSSEATTGNA